ncbi:MAG: hypothetical protein ACO3N7_05530 [Kiritimatiellia bacterium]
MTTSSPWHFQIQANSKPNGFLLGDLSLFWKIKEGDWIVGTRRDAAAAEGSGFKFLSEPEPEGVDWRRLASVDEIPRIQLQPAFPNRPVVVRPEFPYTLVPGERVNIFVGVPVWLSLTTPQGLLLWEEPVHRLSNTWFGTPTDGELCYAMRTLARREGENLDFGPERIICPVRIRNQTKEIISFERLCLRVQYLNIYETSRKGLWANESSVMMRGDVTGSRVAFASKAPAMLKDAKLLVQGKEDARGTFSISVSGPSPKERGGFNDRVLYTALLAYL